LQVGLRDINKAPVVAAQIQLAVGYMARSWQEREQVWLGVFQFFGVMAYIIVFTIIVVAGLGMFNTLVMIVMEKTREIAILRSMGFTRADIAFIFMMQGAIVLVAGVLVGWGIGALATWGIESVPLQVRGIFASSHIMVAWRYAPYIGAALASMVVVAVASWVPARRAARLEPAAIIRGASQ
jgi:lipoprotein-releasing system permease protein